MKLILWFLFAFIHSEWRYVVACSNLIDISKAYIIKIRCNIFFYYVRYSIYQFPFSVSVSKKIKKMKPKSQTQGRIRMKNCKSLIDSPLYVRILCSGCFEIIRLHFFSFSACIHAYARTQTHNIHMKHIHNVRMSTYSSILLWH